MKKKILAAGLLAGGIAVTGLAGSAYATSGDPAGKPGAKAKGPAGTIVTCVATGGRVRGVPGDKGAIGTKDKAGAIPGKGERGPLGPKGEKGFTVAKGNGEKGAVWTKGPGTKPIPVPPPDAELGPVPPKGAKRDARFTVLKGAPGVKPVPPKGAHCTVGKPGSLPPLPVR